MAKNTLIVPESLPLEHAALTEPLACVVRGLEETGARRGDSVVVIGAGPIGLMFMHVAQLSGMKVIAVVKRDEQIVSATTFGATHVVQTLSVVDAVAAVRALTPDHRGVDIAIEAVATPMTWQWAVDMVRRWRDREFLWWLRCRHQGGDRLPAALQRHYAQGELPPYAGGLPQSL